MLITQAFDAARPSLEIQIKYLKQQYWQARDVALKENAVLRMIRFRSSCCVLV